MGTYFLKLIAVKLILARFYGYFSTFELVNFRLIARFPVPL